MMKALLLGLGLLAGTAGAVTNDELLDAEEAFPASIARADTKSVEVRFQIAPGYYLYRDRLRFHLASQTGKLGAPVLPKGKVKQDEFFGKVQIYRGQVTVKLPLLAAKPGDDLQLKVEAQGCADIGVCYPVFEQALSFKLPGA
jgi:thiol:disulfide interchange protein DsbD